MKPIVCIAGPTASGKTAFAVAMAKELNGEVVSCDSMQIYRRMDIGTAKPTADEMQNIPHHMIDVAEPDEDFSVSRLPRSTHLSPRIAARKSKTKSNFVAPARHLIL